MSIRIGWIGTGLMGSRMAANLLKAGHAVTVWNRTRAKVEPLLAQGAAWAGSPAALAGAADVLMTSLTDAAAVGDVLLRQGAAAALRPGSLMIDLSSIAPVAAREHARLLAMTGVV